MRQKALSLRSPSQMTTTREQPSLNQTTLSIFSDHEQHEVSKRSAAVSALNKLPIKLLKRQSVESAQDSINSQPWTTARSTHYKQKSSALDSQFRSSSAQKESCREPEIEADLLLPYVYKTKTRRMEFSITPHVNPFKVIST